MPPSPQVLSAHPPNRSDRLPISCPRYATTPTRTTSSSLPPTAPPGTADDGSDCEHEEPVRVDVYDGLDTGSLDVMCRTISWLADLAADVPAQADFTFVPPATAPKYPSPLRIECSKEQLPLATVQRLALVASLLLNRPHYPPDESLVSYLQRPGVLSGKYEATTHQMLLEHSDPDMRGAYCKASRFIQRAIRPLITTFPWISVDILTPLEAFPPRASTPSGTSGNTIAIPRAHGLPSSCARPAAGPCLPPRWGATWSTSTAGTRLSARSAEVTFRASGHTPIISPSARRSARATASAATTTTTTTGEEEEVCARAPKRRRIEE
ncbi:hypothetical protein MVEN_02292400 [Mycena venus]|uniref:Uncharacterized protein n=1 Tax=Mycena venus TaxID=2733690 RepID=A0A8H6X5Y5_9AGAR|nr:hypothetical protein MVEN_02292400 [Mycena venus]